MKIFDCTTYYDEELIIDLRFNVLNEYVDKFIVCEAKFSHAGKEKKLNFDIHKYPKFKDKIIYVVLENEPANLIYEDNLKKIELTENVRTNSIKRIAYQRNKLFDAVNKVSDMNDYIFYSDNDEIPNLELFNPKKIKKRLLFLNKNFFIINSIYYVTELIGTELEL